MAGSHDIVQAACFQWLWNMYPFTRRLCWHVPNELMPFKGESSKDHLIRIQRAKAIGVVKGVVDLMFYWKGVLYIFDIKIGNDRLSAEQKDFIKQVESQGGVFNEIETLEQFQKVIIALDIK